MSRDGGVLGQLATYLTSPPCPANVTRALEVADRVCTLASIQAGGAATFIDLDLAKST